MSLAALLLRAGRTRGPPRREAGERGRGRGGSGGGRGPRGGPGSPTAPGLRWGKVALPAGSPAAPSARCPRGAGRFPSLPAPLALRGFGASTRRKGKAGGEEGRPAAALVRGLFPKRPGGGGGGLVSSQVPGAAAARPAGSLAQGKLPVSPRRNLQYGWTAYLLGDRASAKFTEYSKVFTVEGNLYSGTAKLAQQVAETLGLRYFPEATIHLLDQFTGDGKKLDLKYNGSCYLETFYNEPKHQNGNSYRLQVWMYCSRFLQTRSRAGTLPYSDFVFLEAMSKQGYIQPRCVKHYYRMKHLSICEILPPHLTLYIDVPVSEVKKRIDETGEPYEKEVSAAYLQSIEDVYKKSFLPQISETSEVLQYTASEVDSLERIIEDIEMLKFNKGPWLEQDDLTLHYLRCSVNDKSKLLSPLAVPDYVPEITIGGLDADSIYHSYKELPGRKYASGYNTDMGDKWIWLK